MSDDKDPRIITPMPKALVEAIDEWRFQNRIASRAEAIRVLVQRSLDDAPARQPEGADR